MILVPETIRMFPSQNVPYLDIGIDDIFYNMLEIKRVNCPNWLDETPSDLGVQILWMYSVLSKWMSDYAEQVKNNSFLITSVDREHVRKHCTFLNYQLGETSAASVTVTFVLEVGHPEFIIPANTKIGTVEDSDIGSIIFETNSSTIVGSGVTTIDIDCTQGETVTEEVVGSSDGSTGQEFTLNSKPVIWQSETVEVYGNNVWTTWTRVDDFMDSNGSDTHYTIGVNEDNSYKVIFNDSKMGKIPNRGVNNIRVTYRKGGGVIGNVAATTITELLSTVNYIISISNIKAASGGDEQETLEHAKLYAPASIKTLKRVVTIEDIEKLAESFTSTQYGSIAKAKGFRAGGLVINVMIVPKSGGNPSVGLRSALQTYLEDKRIIGTSLQVINPSYKPISISLHINIKKGFATSEVIANVRRRLIAHISPTYQDPTTNLYPHGFGRDIYLSDLYTVIDTTDGVDNSIISSPTTDTIVEDYRIINVTTISINAESSVGDTSYYQSQNLMTKGTEPGR